jgi:hypothetical protein
MYKFTALLISVLLVGFMTIQAQTYSHKTLPNVYITGDEVQKVIETPTPDYQIPQSGTVYSKSFTWTWTTCTDVHSGYDMQTNASAHEIFVT